MMIERWKHLARCSMILAWCALIPVAAAQDVVIHNAWTRATVPGQQTAGIYLEIRSSSDAVLVGVQSARAKKAELHETRMESGVMKMRAVSKVALPAGKTVKFAPGGLHVMLSGLERPLAANETITLEVIVERGRGVASRVNVEVAVRGVAGSDRSHAH